MKAFNVLPARIAAVADIYDALATTGPKYSREEGIVILLSMKGTVLSSIRRSWRL